MDKFKADVWNVSFEKILITSRRARRLGDADWNVIHELSSSSGTVLGSLQARVQEKDFDAELVSDLKTGDPTSFERAIVEDKGVVVTTENVKVYEVRLFGFIIGT